MTVETMYSLTNICKKMQMMGYKDIIVNCKDNGDYEFLSEGKTTCIFDGKEKIEYWI